MIGSKVEMLVMVEGSKVRVDILVTVVGFKDSIEVIPSVTDMY